MPSDPRQRSLVRKGLELRDNIGIHIAEWEAQELLRIKKEIILKWIWGEQVSFRFRTTFCCDFNVFMLFYVLYIRIYTHIYISLIFLLFSILNK